MNARDMIKKIYLGKNYNAACICQNTETMYVQIHKDCSAIMAQDSLCIL